MDMKVGDTVIIKGVVRKVSTDYVHVETSPKRCPLMISQDRISEVIPAPIELVVGETYTWKNYKGGRTVIWFDDTSVVYKSESGRRHLTLKSDFITLIEGERPNMA